MGCVVGGSGLGGEGVPGTGGAWSQEAWWRPPRRLLLRAVRILLECILANIAVNDYDAKESTCFSRVLLETELIVSGNLCSTFNDRGQIYIVLLT